MPTSKTPTPFGWRYYGQERPAFAIPPGPGQESVWDYPRPPRIEADTREIIVSAQGTEIARTTRAVRVLETASPPTFYLPLTDVTHGALIPGSGSSTCEWKGNARYWSVRTTHGVMAHAAWMYPDPYPAFRELREHVSFYPGQLHCTVGGEQVRRQPGSFYGGWLTPDIVGPVKGTPDTSWW